MNNHNRPRTQAETFLKASLDKLEKNFYASAKLYIKLALGSIAEIEALKNKTMPKANNSSLKAIDKKTSTD